MVALLGPDGRPLAKPASRSKQTNLRAFYDSAYTSEENAQHWAMAQSSSANTAANQQRRLTIRNRARYEVANNCYLAGIVDTLANDTIGPGPTLQVKTKDPGRNADIEGSWHAWAREVKLAEKLWTVRRAKAVDGAGWLQLVTDRRLRHPVKLNVRPVEDDQIQSPWDVVDSPTHYDGVEVDRTSGDPIKYWVLKFHPYASVEYQNVYDGHWIPATQMLHFFRQSRPGQLRGVSEIVQALPIAAILRRWTLAVLGAAETAADHALLIETDSSPDDDPENDCVKYGWVPFEQIPLERRMAMTLPYGWKAHQLKAEQPTTHFADFERRMIVQMGRCVQMPATVALGDSSDYNYAAGRLDFQVYDRSNLIERKMQMELHGLDPIFRMWLVEYLSDRSGIAPSSIDTEEYEHAWHWKPREHADPEKEANAKKTLWEIGLRTDDELLAEDGIDPETHYEQMKQQVKRRNELGLPVPGVQPGMKPLNQTGQAAAGAK